jgi:hypothetical protein
VSDVLQAWMVL